MKMHVCTQQPCPVQEQEMVDILNNSFSANYTNFDTPMKKYRVTDANEVLRPGQEVIFCGPESRYCLSQGIFIHEIELQNHPTWYEEVKPERWRAKDGDAFWYIQSWISVAEIEESLGNLQSNFLFERGNYFQTKEQAEEAAKRVRACLRAYQEEITK